MDKLKLTWTNTDIKKNDSRSVYDKNYLKIKIKSYGDKVTDFYNKSIPS